jgi:hypothetical protein
VFGIVSILVAPLSFNSFPEDGLDGLFLHALVHDEDNLSELIKGVLINKIKAMSQQNNDSHPRHSRGFEHFHRLKQTGRHSSHQKTQPIALTYYPSTGKTEQEQPISEGPAFRNGYNRTIDDPKSKMTSAIDSKKKLKQSVEQIYHLKKNAYKNYIR